MDVGGVADVTKEDEMNEVNVVSDVKVFDGEIYRTSTVQYRGHTIEIHQEPNDCGACGEYRAGVWAVDANGNVLGDGSITVEAIVNHGDEWARLENTSEDLTQNDEFMGLVKRIVDGRIESEAA